MSYFNGNKCNHVYNPYIKSVPKDSDYDLMIFPKAAIELSLAWPYYFSVSSYDFSTFNESTKAFDKSGATLKYNY